MKFQSINPATEELVSEFEGLDLASALAKAKTCGQAQKKWTLQRVDERVSFLKKLSQILRADASHYATLITLEMGKPISQARAEVEKCAVLCEYYAEHTPKFLAAESIATEAKKSYVQFDPLGVVLCIMPWNFPFWQVFRCAVPAIAAGNGIILKHASNVPQCALALHKIFHQAEFPEGLFQGLLIDSKTALLLIEHDAVDAVSLTGSTKAGSEVAQVAGKYLKKCILELGGSDPFIILADGDLALCCQTALQARMINTGQSCIAAKRFIIEKSVYAECEKKFVELFKKLTVGNPLDESVSVGPLAKPEIRDDIQQQVDDAVEKGAKVLVGGKRIEGKGYFYEPTLITGVSKDMALYREETFGPVMALFSVENMEEAVSFANDSEFGLGASIWTKNIELAQQMASQIEAGFVSINGMVKSDPRLPFGGVKKSGFGRELGSYGIKEFVNVKTVVVNK